MYRTKRIMKNLNKILVTLASMSLEVQFPRLFSVLSQLMFPPEASTPESLIAEPARNGRVNKMLGIIFSLSHIDRLA